jgi:hypothetical protein
MADGQWSISPLGTTASQLTQSSHCDNKSLMKFHNSAQHERLFNVQNTIYISPVLGNTPRFHKDLPLELMVKLFQTFNGSKDSWNANRPTAIYSTPYVKFSYTESNSRRKFKATYSILSPAEMINKRIIYQCHIKYRNCLT